MTIEDQFGSSSRYGRFSQRDQNEYRLPQNQEPYPLATIPPLIRGAIEDVWDELRASYEVIATAALGVVAVVCQGFVNVKRRPTFPPSSCSLFLISVTGVSEAKSEVMKRFLTSISDFERDEERRAKKGNVPARKVVYGTGSFAGFRRGLKENCRAAGIVSAEAGNIINDQLMTRHMPTWNSLWSGEDLKETFSKVEYFVESPRWTAALMLQPDQFEKFLRSNHGDDAAGNGFLARALVARSRLGASPTIDPDYEPSTARLALFHQRVKAILEQRFPEPEECVVLTFSDLAYRYWVSYFNEIGLSVDSGFFGEKMSGFVKKLPEQAARIAALFHYFSHYSISAASPDLEEVQDVDSTSSGNDKLRCQEISEQTIRNAVRLCDWYMIEYSDHVSPLERSPAPTSVSYEQKIEKYGRSLYDWVQENHSRLSREQGKRCIKIDYRMFQQAKRNISKPGELHAAMDRLGGQAGFRVNFFGTGRAKFVCHEPNGNFCRECEKPDRQSPVSMPRHHGTHLQGGGLPSVHLPHYANVAASGTSSGENSSSLHQQGLVEDATSKPGSLLDEVRARYPRGFSD